MTAVPRNKVREDFLKRQGIKFQFVEELPINQIRLHLTNVRFEPLSESNVSAMVATLDGGSKLEPVIVSKNGSAYDGIDCHHRIAAYNRSGVKTCPAIVCEDLSDSQILRLQRTCNVWNGMGNDRHRVEHAAALVSAGEMEISEAAKVFGCSVSGVRQRVNASVVKSELQDQGIKISTELPDSVLASMMKIRKRTVAFLPAAKLVKDADMTASEVARVARELADAPDDAAVHEIISKHRTLLSDRIQKRKTRTPLTKHSLATKLSRHLTGITNLASQKTFYESVSKKLSPSQKEAMAEQLKEARKVINVCLRVLT